MKTTFAFFTICAVLCIVCAVPLRSDEELAKSSADIQQGSEKANEQHDFHFYQRASKQDSELARQFMSALSSKNDVEMQGLWDMFKKAAVTYLTQPQNRRENGKAQEKAKEQHSFHFYQSEKASKQDGELTRQLISALSAKNDAEMQGLSSALWRAALNYLNQRQNRRENEETREKAKEQHSFHFYQRASKQDSELTRQLINALSSKNDAEMQGFGSALWNGLKNVALDYLNRHQNRRENEETREKAKEQHSFHFYQRASKQDSELTRQLMSALSAKNDAEMQGLGSILWKGLKSAAEKYLTRGNGLAALEGLPQISRGANEDVPMTIENLPGQGASNYEDAMTASKDLE